MNIEAALTAIRQQPTIPNVQETVQLVWRARPGEERDFERHFRGLLSEVWHLSTCRDAELLALYAKAADLRAWGQPLFATDEEVLSFHPDALQDQPFLTETWTEIEWDGSGRAYTSGPKL
jgi:hypothetical protein